MISAAARGAVFCVIWWFLTSSWRREFDRSETCGAFMNCDTPVQPFLRTRNHSATCEFFSHGRRIPSMHLQARSANLPKLTDATIACRVKFMPEVVDSDPTYIMSPNYDGISKYPPNSFCVWDLVAPPGKEIHLTFEEFSLRDSFNCSLDYLAVYAGQDMPPSGGDDVRPPLVKWCGPWSPGEYAVAASSGAKLTFASSAGPDTSLGFVARFSIKDAPVEDVCKDDQLRCRNDQCVDAASKCDHQDDCGDGTDEENCGFPLLANVTCGQPTVRPFSLNDGDEGDTYIVGGRQAKPDSWPWQASLRLYDDPVYGHKCGAAILNEQWLVSAAHCFRNWGEPSDWIVFVGKYFLIEEETTQQERYVDSIFVHPGYQMEVKPTLIENRKDHDIALLKLNAPLKLNDQVQPICFSQAPELPDNTTCYVTGWGATEKAQTSAVLKQAAVLVLPQEDCIHYYNGTFVINDLMYCAGYSEGQHDSCHGDSGGPLVVEQSGRWLLAGVVSGGLKCGAPHHPGIYTKLAPHYDWIQDVIFRNHSS